MSPDEVHVSDKSSSLETDAFRAQLHRLESLQTLMKQGSAVVGEVAEFVVRAREELAAFQREQLNYADAQRVLAEEKAILLQRVAELQKSEEDAALRQREQSVVIEALRAQVEAGKTTGEASAHGEERLRAAQEKLNTSQERIVLLEAEIKRERESREKSINRTRQEQLSLHGNEIALLKSRLAVVENQLEAERERRSRLMEVVRSHDVTVGSSAHLERQLRTP